MSTGRCRVRATADAAVVEWDGRHGPEEFRIERVPDAQPRWVGSAADLEAATDRRSEGRVVDALIEFGEQRDESVALFHDDGRIEYLTG